MATIEIVKAVSEADFCAVANLLRAFDVWRNERYRDDEGLVAGYDDQKAWETELNQLSRLYAGQGRAMLLGYLDGLPAGCVALREFAPGISEMKRMFVSDAARGKGLGRALAVAVIDRAREMGFHTMRLETGYKQVEAETLYRQLGFRAIDAYAEYPQDVAQKTVFMEKQL